MTDKINVAINGPGRTGKNIIWSWADLVKKRKTNVEIVAINGIRDLDKDGLRFFVEMLKFDSAQGRKFDEIPYGKTEEDTDSSTDQAGWIKIHGKTIHIYNNRGDVSTLPWAKHKIDVVIDATGINKTKEQTEGHLKAGAKKVIITAPAKGIDCSLVIGTNSIKPGSKIIDCASCTTNAITGVVDAINKKFKIKRGTIITVHAPTDSQNLLDGAHKELRKTRSSLNNIIPTTTGAAKAVVGVLPELQGKLNALAFRVPGVLTGSIVGLIADVEKPATKEEINDYFKELSQTKQKGILGYEETEIVSGHIVGRSESGIIDSLITDVADKNHVSVWSWYDNEYGYATRVLEAAEIFGKME